jgi:hypothetical protein
VLSDTDWSFLIDEEYENRTSPFVLVVLTGTAPVTGCRTGAVSMETDVLRGERSLGVGLRRRQGQ